jgi:transposase-like protein
MIWVRLESNDFAASERNFTPAYREQAVKSVIETSRPIARVAKELGLNEGTLGNWVSAYKCDHAGEEPP